ncbi:MAG TPA: efflux RND transporter periplasmic adaptor subunit [Opitutaceae bacterium]
MSASHHHGRHRLTLLAIGILLAAGAGLEFALPNRANAAQPAGASAPAPATRVTVAPVEEKIITASEELTGRVDATETVELRARVSGHLEAVHFQAGQLVKKGDVLFTIDPRWYQAQYDLTKAQSEVAEREARRAENLLAANAISSEEAESRRSLAAQARASFETAQLDLEHTMVRAPIDGQVSRALVTPGNLISGTPASATVLTTIVSVGDAYVYADLDEDTVLRFRRFVREGRINTENGRVPVEMELEDETGYPRHGYVESADNHLNPSTGSLVLRMIFPNTDRALVPGMFARVRLPVAAPAPTLLISDRAIGTDQSQKYVFTVGADHTVVYRTVKLGPLVNGKRVVLDGLHRGEQIVVNGTQRVRPGMTVEPEALAEAHAKSAPVEVAAR